MEAVMKPVTFSAVMNPHLIDIHKVNYSSSKSSYTKTIGYLFKSLKIENALVISS